MYMYIECRNTHIPEIEQQMNSQLRVWAHGVDFLFDTPRHWHLFTRPRRYVYIHIYVYVYIDSDDMRARTLTHTYRYMCAHAFKRTRARAHACTWIYARCMGTNLHVFYTWVCVYSTHLCVFYTWQLYCNMRI